MLGKEHVAEEQPDIAIGECTYGNTVLNICVNTIRIVSFLSADANVKDDYVPPRKKPKGDVVHKLNASRVSILVKELVIQKI